MGYLRYASVMSAVIFFASGLGIAQDDGVVTEQSAKDRKGRIYQELNLTAEQQKLLDENRNTQGQEMKRLMQALKEKKEQLGAVLKDPAATRAQAESIAADIKSLQAQMLDQRIKGIFSVKEILTPEQYAKFQQIAQERRTKMKGRFDKKQQRQNRSKE